MRQAASASDHFYSKILTKYRWRGDKNKAYEIKRTIICGERQVHFFSTGIINVALILPNLKVNLILSEYILLKILIILLLQSIKKLAFRSFSATALPIPD